eukprot:scaffold185559_cov22-Prasinocladus_malaysianus.AAC.1
MDELHLNMQMTLVISWARHHTYSKLIRDINIREVQFYIDRLRNYSMWFLHWANNTQKGRHDECKAESRPSASRIKANVKDKAKDTNNRAALGR